MSAPRHAFTIVRKVPLDGKTVAALYPPRTPFALWTDDESLLFFPGPSPGTEALVTFVEDE